ncbi:hypothetical protein [Martelella soudanensis]|uniref:hypothetical protein n=1 Tax=unclassified Martelella TaxID=2629616 RepID=UPI0015E04FA9|nr:MULTISPECIES: hypothetical protein [unclassified Martelella]
MTLSSDVETTSNIGWEVGGIGGNLLVSLIGSAGNGGTVSVSNGGTTGTGDDVAVLADADILVTTGPADIEEPTDESFEQKLRDVLGATAVDFIELQVDTFGLKTLMVDAGLFEDDDVVSDTEGRPFWMDIVSFSVGSSMQSYGCALGLPLALSI